MVTPNDEEMERKVVCTGECKGRRSHDVLHLEKESGGDDDYGWWAEHRLVKCRGCGNVQYELTTRNTEDIDETGLYETVRVYPPLDTTRPAMSEANEYLSWELDHIYDEALAAFNHGLFVLATVGIRALVEAVCAEQGATKYKLAHKIDELVANKTWPQHYAAVLHEIRFLGNDAAHGFTAVPKRELSDALDAVEEVLRAVYVLPAQTELLRRRRAKREAKK